MEQGHPLSIKLPANMIISGATNTGKTALTMKLLKNKSLFRPPPSEIVYLYKHYQNQFRDEPDIRFIGSLSDFKPRGDNVVLVLDDQLGRVTPDMVDYFIAGRHRNISVIFLMQNIYYNDPSVRTINANASHFIFMKSPRSAMQIDQLARQCLPPGARRRVCEAYHDSVKRPYGYLWINLDGGADEAHRFASNVCPEPGTFQTVYKL